MLVAETLGTWSVNTDRNFEQGKPAIIWGPRGPGWGIVCEMRPVYPREFCPRLAYLLSKVPEMLSIVEELAAGCHGKAKEIVDNIPEPIDNAQPYMAPQES